jgi:hypothetical protein
MPHRYNSVVQKMLIVWMCILACVVIIWVYMRWLLAKLRSAWSANLAQSEAQWDRDLWAPSQQGERANKLRVQLIKRDAYEEVAKPLEPYVVVFILFAVPAAVMSTDYCVDNSGASSANASRNISYGTCNAWCEMILSFRSIATVAA